MKTTYWLRLAAIGVCCISTLILVGWFFQYCAGIVFPFAAAAVIATVLRPAAARIRQRTHLPEKLCGTMLILFAVVLLGISLLYLGYFLYDAMRDLIAILLDEAESGTGITVKILTLTEKYRLLPQNEYLQTLYAWVVDLLRESARNTGTALTTCAGSLLLGLPRGLLGVIVAVIALFYLFFDGDLFRRLALEWLGDASVTRLHAIARRAAEGIGAWLRAYLLLLLLTFFELLIGFLLLNTKNAVRIAAITALVDLLPVLGAGTVLIPWSIGSFLLGDPVRGSGLLFLFCIMYVVRQFAEPRIVGGALGVHPLLSLFAVYAGFRLGGFGGVLLAPFLLVLVQSILRAVKENSSAPQEQKNPPRH